jgi:hypothetical protein
MRVRACRWPCLSLSLSISALTLVLRQRTPEQEEQLNWMIDGQPRQGRVTQRLQRVKEAVHNPVHEPAQACQTRTLQ